MVKVKAILKHKNFLFNLILLLLIIFPSGYALDYSIKNSDPQECYGPGTGIFVGFEAKGTKRSDFLRPFKCRINFDGAVLKYKKVICKNSVKRSDIQIEKFDNYLEVTCMPKALRELYLKNGTTEIFDLIFSVNKRVGTQETPITAEFKSCEKNSELNFQEIKLNISGNPIFENCKLSSLKINNAKLTPAFSPDICEYTAILPPETEQPEILATPMVSGLDININKRKSYNFAKGATVTVTVSNKSLKVKSVYTINMLFDENVNQKLFSAESFKSPENSLHKSSENAKSVENAVSKKINILESDKISPKIKSSKTVQKSNSRKNKKSSKNSSNSDNSSSEEDESESESEDNYTCDDSENDYISENSEEINTNNSVNSKMYWIIAATTLAFSVASYGIVKFIKSKKKYSENLNKPINNNSKI